MHRARAFGAPVVGSPPHADPRPPGPGRWPGVSVLRGPGPQGAPLTGDEVVLLGLIASGLAPPAIARRLRVHERTVRRRISRVCERLGVSTPIEAVVLAVRQGLL